MSGSNARNYSFCVYLVIIYTLVILFLYFIHNSNTFLNNFWKPIFGYLDQNIAKQNEYKVLHESEISKKQEPRIVFNNNPDAYGYANRVYSVLSSLLIAILSDRALLIKWKYIDNYIEPPLYRVFDIFNETNELNINYKSNLIESFGFGEAWKRNKTIKIDKIDVLKMNKTRVKFEQITAYFFELCCYPQYYDKLLYYGLVSNKTIDKARRALENKTHISKSKEQDVIFQVGFEVGGNLLRYFWKPKAFLQNQIEAYYEKYFKGNFVIGLQLRFYYLNETKDIQMFINCAQQIESYYNKIHVFKWFISSDSENFIKHMQEKYPEKVIATNGTIENIAYNKLDGYNRTILDSELLSLCNRIIITGGSTFGFVSAMKSQRLPYYINGQSSMKVCKLMKLSDGTKNQFGFALFKK
jgi:hypothetical protein